MAMRFAVAVVVLASALPAQAQFPYAQGIRFTPRPVSGVPAIRRPATGSITVQVPRSVFGPGFVPYPAVRPGFGAPYGVRPYYSGVGNVGQYGAFRQIGPIGPGVVAPGTYFYPNRISRLNAQRVQVVGPNRVLVDQYGRRIYQNVVRGRQQSVAAGNGASLQQTLSSPSQQQFIQGQVPAAPGGKTIQQVSGQLPLSASQSLLLPKPETNPLPPPSPTQQSSAVAKPAVPVVPASSQADVPADPPEAEAALPPADPVETDLPPVIPPAPGEGE